MTTRLTVEVLGQSYDIKCNPRSVDKLRDAVGELIAMCNKVEQSQRNISRDRLLVTAALNLASQLVEVGKLQREYDERLRLLNQKIDLIK